METSSIDVRSVVTKLNLFSSYFKVVIKFLLDKFSSIPLFFKARSRQIKTFRLKRVSYHDIATFGVLMDDDLPFCVTLERPWMDNRRNVSCIPPGLYICKRVNSPKFGDTFEVTNVVDRSHILFHKGNLAEDTHGCIIVGELFDPLDGEHAVLSSGKAFTEFKKILHGELEFTLVISSS